MEDYKYLFKVVLVGNAGVGKTCLVRRFTQVKSPFNGKPWPFFVALIFDVYHTL
jgi:GTPase SAR1 family protein